MVCKRKKTGNIVNLKKITNQAKEKINRRLRWILEYSYCKLLPWWDWLQWHRRYLTIETKYHSTMVELGKTKFYIDYVIRICPFVDTVYMKLFSGTLHCSRGCNILQTIAHDIIQIVNLKYSVWRSAQKRRWSKTREFYDFIW